MVEKKLDSAAALLYVANKIVSDLEKIMGQDQAAKIRKAFTESGENSHVFKERSSQDWKSILSESPPPQSSGVDIPVKALAEYASILGEIQEKGVDFTIGEGADIEALNKFVASHNNNQPAQAQATASQG